MLTVGLDVGSTTVKASVDKDGATCWQDYKRHDTNRPRCCSSPGAHRNRMRPHAGACRVFITGSGSGLLAPLIGAKVMQEVVAVSLPSRSCTPT